VYASLLSPTSINEKSERDYIIPITKPLITNSMIIRGEYKDITIIVYGEIPDEKISTTILNCFKQSILMNNYDIKVALE